MESAGGQQIDCQSKNIQVEEQAILSRHCRHSHHPPLSVTMLLIYVLFVTTDMTLFFHLHMIEHQITMFV